MSSAGRMVVLIDRGDYWQCAFLIPKGAAEESRRAASTACASEIAGAASRARLVARARRASDDLHLLSVELDRLDRWHRPGLLAIGDAAHAMSPIGGIGINLAIQDAVAAANVAGRADGARRGSPIRCCTRCRSGACSRRGSSRPGRSAAQDRVIGAVLAGAPITQRAAASCACSTASRCCGGFRAG